ncbi:MAG: hypothetical protein KBF40_12825, partial [Giesbergeria sp.]|nr:hypothetical protein [Giesbergeria sp.]
MRLAVAATRHAISPRFAISIFLNMVVLRGAIACARCACHAIWLRRCAALRLVTAAGNQDFFKHSGLSLSYLEHFAQELNYRLARRLARLAVTFHRRP